MIDTGELRDEIDRVCGDPNADQQDCLDAYDQIADHVIIAAEAIRDEMNS
jgi:hypothetical protein